MEPSAGDRRSTGTPIWSVTSTFADDHLVLSFFGELDVNAASYANVELMMPDAVPRSVLIDLAGLTFIDSTGVRLVLRLHERVRELGGSPQIVSWPQHVRLFDVVRRCGAAGLTSSTSVVRAPNEDTPAEVRPTRRSAALGSETPLLERARPA